MAEFAANCSTLFRDLPFLERFGQAHLAGFGLVESWWPFASPTPAGAEVRDLADALGSASVRYACMNLYAGNLDAGERGILNDPSRTDEFRAGVAAAAALSSVTKCRLFNALAGLEPEPPSPIWSACAMGNLAFASESLAAVGAALVIEPLCRTPRYSLRSADAVLAVVDSLTFDGHTNVGVLADLYQLAATDTDVPRLLREHAEAIRHIQIADDPGRGAPGTGHLPLFDWLGALESSGYRGAVGLEYLPTPGVDPFAWIPRWYATGRAAGGHAEAAMSLASDTSRDRQEG